MTAWVLRAISLGALVVALRVLLGFAMATLPTYGLVWRAACLIVLVGTAVAWGLRDGRVGGADLTVRWLAAGFGAGLSSSAVCWVLDQIPRVELGDSGALFEMTSAASFIMLLIFLPAMGGVAFALGRSRRSREAAETAESTAEPELATA
ncbi:B-4DMT family transporter [Nocardia sp. SSK8]|uniref:B-4DMT family transporter n=1 Tax=Nocardia sp. SSK8 TaxID=3120154 RepID=UPI00300985D7